MLGFIADEGVVAASLVVGFVGGCGLGGHCFGVGVWVWGVV